MNDQGSDGELGARARMQRGSFGDRIPGFDPAAAPLETGAEAGGSSLGAPATSAGEAVRPAQTSTGFAMRDMLGRRTSGRGSRLSIGLYLAAIAVIALAAAIVMGMA